MMVPAAVRFCAACPDEMVNDWAGEIPPPGAGLNTVTCAVPAVTTSPAGMAAVTRVALTKVVGRSVPFQRTVEPATKFEPLTLRLKAALPAAVLAGVSEANAGTGLFAGGGGGGVPVPGPKTSNSATEMNAAEPPGAPKMRMASPLIGANCRL